MQNKYVGDIGDFGKYGLLRALLPCFNKLGIIWYLVPDETHLNDGKHTDYLNKLKFVDCDKPLLSVLKNIVSSGKRNISEIEQSDIFNCNTVFHSDYLSYNGVKANSPKGRQIRLSLREAWLNNALKTVQSCDAIFMDPDNGLEVPSALKHSAKAPKYTYYDEVEKFLSGRDTLIIYHHLCRNTSHLEQIKVREKVLQNIVGMNYKVISLKFKVYSPRVYFVITNQERVLIAIEEFLNSNWKMCFEALNADKTIKQRLEKIIGHIPSESGFRKRMRLHQGWWRAFVLGEEEGEHPFNIQKTVCNTIRDGENSKKNFLTDTTIKVVEQTLKERNDEDSGIIQEDRLYNNLLSSQPLCFNFFSELKSDYDLALKLMNNLGFQIDAVGDVIFEYAPVANYTNDNSAFDIALEVTREGKKGLIGLECKYTDTFSVKEYDRPAYREIFEKSNIFLEEYEKYKASEFNQLFRNQLIAEAIKQNSEYEFVITGLFCHKDDKAIETGFKFQEMLKGNDDTFKIITYQDFITGLQRLDINWEQREFSMMLWARYCGTQLSDGIIDNSRISAK